MRLARLALRLGPWLTLSLGCATAPIPPAPPMAESPTGWLEMRSPHFTLRTDLHHKEAFSALYRLENTWWAMNLTQWGASPPDSAPLEVIEVRLPREMAEFGVESFGTTLSSTKLGPLLIVGGLVNEQRDFVAPGAVGEYLLREHHHHQPAWLAEGLRGLFGTVRYAEDGDSLQIGGALIGALRGRAIVSGYQGASDISWIRVHGRMGAAQLFRFDPAHLGEETNALRFESTSWLLVTFLRQTRPAAFLTFQTRLDRGEGFESAWVASFPDLTADAVDHVLQVFLDEGLFAFQRQPLSPEVLKPHPIPGLVQRPCTEDEVHAIRAQLFLSALSPQPAEERVARARAELALASSGGALSPSALEVSLAWMAPAQLREAARQTVAGVPDDPRAWRALAATEVAPEEAAARAEALDHLLQLRPSAVEALATESEIFLAQGREADSLRAAARAWALQSSPSVLRLVARASAAVGQCNPAHEEIRLAAALVNPSDPKTLGWSIAADADAISSCATPPTLPPASPPAGPPAPPATAQPLPTPVAQP